MSVVKAPCYHKTCCRSNFTWLSLFQFIVIVLLMPVRLILTSDNRGRKGAQSLYSVCKNSVTQNSWKISTGSHLAPSTVSLSSVVLVVMIKLSHTENMQTKTLFCMQMLLSATEHCAPRLPILSVLNGKTPFGGSPEMWTVMQA